MEMHLDLHLAAFAATVLPTMRTSWVLNQLVGKRKLPRSPVLELYANGRDAYRTYGKVHGSWFLAYLKHETIHKRKCRRF